MDWKSLIVVLALGTELTLARAEPGDKLRTKTEIPPVVGKKVPAAEQKLEVDYPFTMKVIDPSAPSGLRDPIYPGDSNESVQYQVPVAGEYDEPPLGGIVQVGLWNPGPAPDTWLARFLRLLDLLFTAFIAFLGWKILEELRKIGKQLPPFPPSPPDR